MSKMKFIDGLIIKPPVKKDGSPLPDFIKAKGSIKRTELIAWLENESGEWVNFDVKESKGGKWYAAVDTWEPDSQKQEYNKGSAQAREAMAPDQTQPFEDSDIPF
tara:strand:+ start:246 stop:560 length:315 start_codon:yes stop_codon:yes gene_type:complete